MLENYSRDRNVAIVTDGNYVAISTCKIKGIRESGEVRCNGTNYNNDTTVNKLEIESRRNNDASP